MELMMFKTLWGHPGTGTPESLELACRQAVSMGFQGIEGPIPAERELTERFSRALSAYGLAYVAEVCTAGSYVPDRRAPLSRHLDDLEMQLARLESLQPVHVNCIGGCDSWEMDTSLAFFEGALALASKYQLSLSFETHRGRSLYSPWITARLLAQMDIPLTCDFSHWVVVCEGLGESEYELLQRVAESAVHIHGRVGFDQGPQVSDPQSDLYAGDLEKHLLWWSWIWLSQQQRGLSRCTVTPEFGPDGYQMIDPSSQVPVGDLNHINGWMAERIREAFDKTCTRVSGNLS